MSLLVPKIVYNPGSGAVTLNFTYPPVNKPAVDEKDAVRHDTITSSGLKQSANERIDKFKTLQMDFVPVADEAAWDAFTDWALTGGEFDYHPDSLASPPVYDTWTLEDMGWKPQRNFRGIDKFTLRLRKVIS